MHARMRRRQAARYACRLMAEDAVDAAVEAGHLQPLRGCVTEQVRLVGAEKYSPALFAHLAQVCAVPTCMRAPSPHACGSASRMHAVQSYHVPHRPGHINIDIARRLTAAYGDQAEHVTAIAEAEGLSRRLVPWHDIIEAEVVYAARHEMCRSATDFLARRTRLAFLDVAAARTAAPRVVDLLAAELGWSWWGFRRAQERRAAEEFLRSFEAQ
jgi:glycerol-3-phosphate dehydrogenase